jgi:hypothetical protein
MVYAIMILDMVSDYDLSKEAFPYKYTASMEMAANEQRNSNGDHAIYEYEYRFGTR